MVNEELIKGIIQMKFAGMEAMVNVLPEDLQEPARNLQNTLIKTLHEVTGEYIEEKAGAKEEKKLKSIVIE